MSFWRSLPRPFTVLAPMEDVTGRSLRALVADIGPPDVFFTEFVSVDLLAQDDPETLDRLAFYSGEEARQRTAVQLWGNHPEGFYQAVSHPLVRRFPAIDLNMGCPARKIVAKGCGASLISDISLAREIIQATQAGLTALGKPRPDLSVKTRLGESADQTQKWLEFLLTQNLEALCVHGRSLSQGYSGRADWTALESLPKARNLVGSTTILIGNGDLDRTSLNDRCLTTNLDGLMVGRAVLGDPGVFLPTPVPFDFERRLNALKRLWELSRDCNVLPGYFQRFKKYVKGFLTDFSEGAEIRQELMAAASWDAMDQLICSYGTTGGAAGNRQ